jgi:hypothetical protein
MAVIEALESIGLLYKYVDLGEVDLIENTITNEQHEQLKIILRKTGLELMDETKSVLIERIKNNIRHYTE